MKKLKYLLLTFVLLVIGIINVRAELATDFSNVSYKVTNLTDTNHAYPYLTIEGVEFVFGDYEYSYYIYIADDKVLPNITSYDTENLIYLSKDSDGVVNPISLTDYFALSGDVYVTIYQQSYDSDSGDYLFEQATEPTKIERPSQLPLEYRIQGDFTWEGSVLINYEPVGDYERQVNVKIGLVTDNTILTNIKNNKTGSMEALLNYAKKDINGRSVVVPDSVSDTVVFSTSELQDEKYYYVYLSYDNENGKYYDVEDIWLTQASVYPEDDRWYLFSKSSSDFSWNLVETIWDKFVANFKESEYLDIFDTASLNVTHTDSNMIVTVDDGLNVYTTEFKYENGIVSYVQPEKASDSQKLLDSILVEAALMEFAELYKYDEESFVKFIDSTTGLTLTKDGIEFVNNLHVLEENAEGGSSTITFTNWKSLKFDLLNGLKTFPVKEEVKDVDTTIENPETGVLVGICVILLTGIAGTVGTVVYRKVNRKNKIAKI